VATVDLSLGDFFEKTSRLGDWLDQLQLGQRGQTYGFVFGHTTTVWDIDDPAKEARRFWNGEAGTGVFVFHPQYRFPSRIKDLPERPADFDEFYQRLLKRDEQGRLVESSGKGRAIDPATGKRSTFLFARVSSAEWTLVVVIEEAAGPEPI
jgi:hypothetical protein